MQLRGDSSSFVLELVGVCRTSEKGDECGINVGALLLTGFSFASAKGSNPVHFLGTTSMIRSLPGFGWIQQYKLEGYLKEWAYAQLHCGTSLKSHVFRKTWSSPEVETVTWRYRHRLQKILKWAIKGMVLKL
jgi:hypothetical protein